MPNNNDASIFHLVVSALDTKGREGTVASSTKISVIVRTTPDSEPARQAVVQHALGLRQVLEVGSQCLIGGKTVRLERVSEVRSCDDAWAEGSSFTLEFSDPVHQREAVKWIGGDHEM